VTFTGTVAYRTAQSEVTADAFVPAICASFAGGCTAIQGFMESVVPDPVCVATAAGDCRCAARIVTLMNNEGDAYTTASHQIISTVSGKHWDYCVAGTQLRYRDVSPTGSKEPGIIELGLR
jgi:hypothetical protein